jgi:adenylate cyclase
MRGISQGWFAAGEGEKALTLARKAVQLEPFDYYNHWDLAFVLWNLGRIDQAMSEYRRAVALNANDADLLAEFAETLAYWGEPLEAIRELERAKEINPFYPDWYHWNHGWALFCSRRYEESLVELQRMPELPNHVRLILAGNLVRLGRGAEAAPLVAEFLQHEPGYTLAKLKRRSVFKRTEDEDHWLEAVREAGLPT